MLTEPPVAPVREAGAGVVLRLRGGVVLTDERWAVLEPLVEACRLPAKVPPSNLRRTVCRGRSKSRPLRRHGLLAQSADDPKARQAVSAWAVWLFGGNEHRPATAPVAGVSSAPVAWISTALYRPE